MGVGQEAGGAQEHKGGSADLHGGALHAVAARVLPEVAGDPQRQADQAGPGGLQIDVMIDQAVAKKIGQFGSSSNKMLRQNYNAREKLVQR